LSAFWRGKVEELGCRSLKVNQEIKHYYKYNLDSECEGNVHNSMHKAFNGWIVYCHLMVAKDDRALGERGGISAIEDTAPKKRVKKRRPLREK
jgi:hypothetical protein